MTISPGSPCGDLVVVVVDDLHLGAADGDADRARLALAVGEVERGHARSSRTGRSPRAPSRRTPRRSRAAPRPASPSRRRRRGPARTTSKRSRSGWCSSAAYIVGTPANVVARSRCDHLEHLARLEARHQRQQPARRARAMFMTEFMPNTWNSGSVGERHGVGAGVDQVARRPARRTRGCECVSVAPLGVPVVPEV